ncbi:MAG TPA: glycosyltransferase family 4 protein [Methanomassiliicoccales archaeon]|jgi:glycosyltransferase involved in cell wall biosynthesis
MKIVLLIRTYPDEVRNGFDAYAIGLIERFRKDGIDFDVLAPKDPRFVDDPRISPILYDLLYPISNIFRRRSKTTIFHAISESQALIFPFIRGKKIVTIHHIEKFELNRGSVLKVNTIYNLFWRCCTDIAVSYSDRIICISEQTKKELVDRYGTEDDKIVVVPQAISDRFAENGSLRQNRLIGYIGPFTARKNLPALFQVLRTIHESPGFDDVKMKICGVGPVAPITDLMSANPDLTGQIIFKGEVPDRQIVEEYNELTAMLYPSLHEGFGLGILEAQRCGVPVFILQNAMIPEEVVRFAIKCASPQDMATKVMDYLRGDLHYDKKKAMEYASTFSEQSRAKKTIAVYSGLRTNGDQTASS